MKEAETGIYCGPLRLLAMEVFDSVNQEVRFEAILQPQCPCDQSCINANLKFM